MDCPGVLRSESRCQKARKSSIDSLRAQMDLGVNTVSRQELFQISMGSGLTPQLGHL